MYVLLFPGAKFSDKPQREREHHQRPMKTSISLLLSGFQIAPEVVNDFEETRVLNCAPFTCKHRQNRGQWLEEKAFQMALKVERQIHKVNFSPNFSVRILC